MKSIYSTLRPSFGHKSYVDWMTKSDQKLSVSSHGLIAFTSSFCLNQRRPQATSYHVYIADINLPHQAYLLVDSEFEFTIVEWDSSGSKLLVCDVMGSVTVYTSKNYLISDWKPYFKQVFTAETFISAAWYHMGMVSTIHVANQNLKSPSNHLGYTDKIQQSSFGASLRLFGGKAAEGCVLISKTGLICCLTLIADGTVDMACESLGPLRSLVEVADICHCKDGSFVVATSSGCINSAITLNQIRLSAKSITLDDVDLFSGLDSHRVQISSTQFSSFHLNIMSQIITERENAPSFECVSHIKFVSKHSPDGILVEVRGTSLSLIELWELEPREKVPVHPVILECLGLPTAGGTNNLESSSQAPDPSESPPTEWAFKGNYITDKDLSTIQTPKFKLFGQDNQLNIILLAFKDSSICCLRKEDLQPINETLDLSHVTSAVRQTLRNGAHNSPQKRFNNGLTKQKPPEAERTKRHTVFITDIQFTCNQATFVAIDSMSQLHAVRLPPLIHCQDSDDKETYLQYLLEYCLVTGNDLWEVIVSVDRENVEGICDKFHDAFERQPKHIQRKYLNRQLMARAALYHCLSDAPSICKASDCHTILMLNSISNTIKSLLRSQDEEIPAEMLSTFLKNQGAESAFFDIGNVISKIRTEDFYVEPNLIQCLHPLNQWVVDLAVHLVASIHQRAKLEIRHVPGAGLIENKEALETIRELLVIIRIWGGQNEAGLPMISRLNDQMDVLATLFQLISTSYNRLCKGQAPDEALINDCMQFVNNITLPHFSFMLMPIGVASPRLHRQPAEPLIFEFFKAQAAPDAEPTLQLEGAINMTGKRKIDVIRNISLGAYPAANLRHCTRCSSVSLTEPSFHTSRVWEQRWIASCVCGGSWAQSDQDFINKVDHLTLFHYNATLTQVTGGRALPMVR